jgi:hypothetical protein
VAEPPRLASSLDGARSGSAIHSRFSESSGAMARAVPSRPNTSLQYGINVRKDLAALCDGLSLEVKSNIMGKLVKTNAPYCLKSIERKDVLM